jgi:conjugative transfer pilus assembly protein TraH
MRRRLISLILILTLAISPALPALASLNDDIENMFRKWGFKATSNDPGAYTAQTRGFITGGSLNLRANYEPINLFSINPPRINAGCGGIDLYFGGINFVNKDQFINMLKAIGQNAIGYAFQIGLEAVCPTCLEQLKSLMNRIQQWQKMLSDSCQVAKSIVNWTAGSLAEASLSSCQDSLIEEGEDADDAQRNCAQSNTTATKLVKLKQDAFSSKSLPRTKVPGNAVLDALQNSDLTDKDKTLVQSLVGTFICKVGDKGEFLCDYVAPTISLRDFLYGNQNVQLLQNKSTDLTNPEIEYVTDSIYPGFKQKVTDMLTQVTSKLTANTALSDEEKSFVDASIIPVKRLIEVTKTTPGLLNSAIDMTSDLMAISMAVATVKKYIHAIESNVGKQSVVERDKLLDRIDSVKRDMNNELMQELNYFEAQVKTFELTSFFYMQVAHQVSPSVAKTLQAKR